jgi:hypothetical protein
MRVAVITVGIFKLDVTEVSYFSHEIHGFLPLPTQHNTTQHHTTQHNITNWSSHVTLYYFSASSTLLGIWHFRHWQRTAFRPISAPLPRSRHIILHLLLPPTCVDRSQVLKSLAGRNHAPPPPPGWGAPSCRSIHDMQMAGGDSHNYSDSSDFEIEMYARTWARG